MALYRFLQALARVLWLPLANEKGALGNWPNVNVEDAYDALFDGFDEVIFSNIVGLVLSIKSRPLTAVLPNPLCGHSCGPRNQHGFSENAQNGSHPGHLLSVQFVGMTLLFIDEVTSSIKS